MSYWQGVLLPMDGLIRIVMRELERTIWNSLLLVGTPVLSSQTVILSRHYWAVGPP